MNYGILSLVPPFAMLIIALKSKKSFEALIAGSLIAYIMLYGINFVGPYCEMLLEEISNADNQYILLLCALFGGFIFILRESKGTNGFSRLVAGFCKGERSVLLTSFLLGVVIFVDDYLNIMTIGTCMKDVCDKRKIPRQALAYVIDSTGAPICALLPFSTWVVFYSGIFYEEQSVVDLGFGSGLSTYLHCIPYMFYPICAVIITFLFCCGVIPKVGDMKKYYKEAAEKAVADNGKAEVTEQEGNILDFLIPIAVLIVVTLITSDMLIAIVLTLAACMALYLPRKLMTFSRMVELFWEGFADMLPVLGILYASFLIRNACGQMGLSEYVISLTEPILTGALLPAIIFLIIAILTFVTSSFWGIEAIAVPIVVPLVIALNGNMLLTLAAVVSGGVFGSHACFYSDATVLSSATVEIDNMSHATSQIPYAAAGAVLATICYLIAGLIL